MADVISYVRAAVSIKKIDVILSFALRPHKVLKMKIDPRAIVELGALPVPTYYRLQLRVDQFFSAIFFKRADTSGRNLGR